MHKKPAVLPKSRRFSPDQWKWLANQLVAACYVRG
jgi:hypothetical protein